MPQLPKYISDLGHGQICYDVPLAISDVTAYGFVLKCDSDKVQHLLDTQLNAVSDGAVTYTALPFLIHAYLDARHCTSTSEVIGWLPDHECAFLIPVIERKPGSWSRPRLKIWVPYLLIDQMAGMVTGREVWGYRKSYAFVKTPDRPAVPDLFYGETMLFKQFSTATEGHWGKLAETRQISNSGSIPSNWRNPGDAIVDVIEKLAGEISGDVLDLLRPLISAIVSFRTPSIPMVNLKQFRDAVDSTRACYQALVDSPCQLDAWHGGGFLDGEFEVEITTCDSHRVVEDLGLADNVGADSTIIKPLYGFYAQIDFSTPPGSIVWQYGAGS